MSMYPHQVQSYLHRFFNELDCPILSNCEHYLTVQLTIDMDKRIMNRPFYWQYVESTNGEPSPAQITFITNSQQVKGIRGEIVHFGSPRLSQFFQVTKELGAYVQMFEHPDVMGQMAFLTPWLCVNYKISYVTNQTREMLYSFGINLVNGSIMNDFYDILDTKKLDNALPDGAFPVQFIIKPERALERLDDVMEQIIMEDDHSWAEEAKIRWQKEQKVLEFFYEDMEEKPECYEVEKKALEERYNPRIKIDIINGGLFYLQ